MSIALKIEFIWDILYFSLERIKKLIQLRLKLMDVDEIIAICLRALMSRIKIAKASISILRILL